MAKEKKIFVVSWAEYDGDDEYLTSGPFAYIYSTLDKAHDAVMQVIRDTVKDDMNCYEKSHWKSVYGTTDFDEVVKKFIMRDGKFFVVVSNPNTDVETRYIITCYDANIVD